MSDTASEASTELFLPDAVRRAAARADELLLAQQAEPSSEPDRTPPAAEPPPAAPEQMGASEPPPTAVSAHDWEQRYRTLQGKYDAEIREIPHLRGQIAGLEQLLATMQTPPAPQQQAPAQTRGPVQYNEEDINLYGQDLLEAATRAAEARYQPVVSRLEAQLAEISGRQSNSSQQLHQDRVFSQLDKDPELHGRWEQINTSHEFRSWLNVLDEYAGVSRFEMLQHAYASGDAMRTGRFFKRFIAEHTVPPTASVSQTAPAPAPAYTGNGHAAPAGSPRLEDFAAPGRAAGGGQGSNGAREPRVWSRPEIQAFYRDRQRGKFKGRDEESTRLEQDIIAAAGEGRIQ